MAYGRTEVFERNEFSKEVHLTIKNLLWLHGQMNWPQSPELTAAYTQGNFTKKEGERWTKMLTERLSNLTDENAEMLLNNKSSMKSKRLSDWWEQYKK